MHRYGCLMPSIETPTVTFSVRTDGVIVGRGKSDGGMRTGAEVAANLAAMDELLEGRRAPGLWFPDSMQGYEPDALQMLIHGLLDRLSAVAIVAPDPPPELAAFPDVVNALLLPVKVFQDEADAEAWLAQFE